MRKTLFTYNWTLGQNMSGEITKLAVYDRALRVSEAIGNYRFYLNL